MTTIQGDILFFQATRLPYVILFHYRRCDGRNLWSGAGILISRPGDGRTVQAFPMWRNQRRAYRPAYPCSPATLPLPAHHTGLWPPPPTPKP